MPVRFANETKTKTILRAPQDRVDQHDLKNKVKCQWFLKKEQKKFDFPALHAIS